MLTRIAALLALLLTTSGCGIAATVFGVAAVSDSGGGGDSAEAPSLQMTVDRSSLVLHPNDHENLLMSVTFSGIETVDVFAEHTMGSDLDVSFEFGGSSFVDVRVETNNAPAQHGAIHFFAVPPVESGLERVEVVVHVAVVGSNDSDDGVRLFTTVQGHRTSPTWAAFRIPGQEWAALSVQNGIAGIEILEGSRFELAVACVFPDFIGNDVQVGIFEGEGGGHVVMPCEVGGSAKHTLGGPITNTPGGHSSTICMGVDCAQGSVIYSVNAEEGTGTLVAVATSDSMPNFVHTEETTLDAPIIDHEIDFSGSSATDVRSLSVTGSGTPSGRSRLHVRPYYSGYETIVIMNRPMSAGQLDYAHATAFPFTLEASAIATALDANGNTIAANYFACGMSPDVLQSVDLTAFETLSTVTLDSAGNPVASLEGTGRFWMIDYATQSTIPLIRWSAVRLDPGAYSFPDFSAVPGWDPAWELPSGQPISWTERTTDDPSVAASIAWQRAVSFRLPVDFDFADGGAFPVDAEWTDHTTQGTIFLP